VAKDERDPVEETSSVDSTADAVDSTAAPDRLDGSQEAADQVDDAAAPELEDAGSTDRDLEDDELEIDDPAALDRATERVSESELGDDDEFVDEPTDAELAALTEGSDATAKAGREGNGAAGDDGELVGVGAPTRGSAAKAKGAKPKTEKKGRATAKQDSHAPVHKRTGPVTFVKESVGELRKVVYPTGPQLLNYFVVVLIFVLFIIAFVSVLDLAFGWAILKVFS
jgi:preprotein translocase subunit SecE